MALLYRRAGRLTSKNGGFQPGQEKRQAKRAAQDAAAVGELGDEITPSLEGAPKTEQTWCE
jgi:hypothetical protein